MICMKLTVVQSVSNNSSLELVWCSDLSIRCRPCSSSFPSRNLNVVHSEVSTDACRIRDSRGWGVLDPCLSRIN